MKKIFFLFATVFLLFSCSNGIEKEYSLEEVSVEEVLSTSEKVTSFEKGTFNLYIHEDDAEYNYVYYDVPLHHFENWKIDSVIYHLNDVTYQKQSIQPVKIYLNKKGEYSLKRLVYLTGENPDKPKVSSSKIRVYDRHPLIENDGVAMGILIIVLALIFWTSSKQTYFWKRFYTFLPALLLCYFVPAILNTFGIIDGDNSNIYHVASRYLLPASLVLLCLSVDLKGIINLGPKALIMFFSATVGIIIGAPIALKLVSLIEPNILLDHGENSFWRGLSTVAGSWIGGGANQTAMKEISNTGDVMFSLMILVDVFIANIWMAFLLLGASKSKKMDERLKADSTAITELQSKIENYQASIARKISFNDLIFMMAIAFGCVAAGHFIADLVAPNISSWIKEVTAVDKTSWVQYIRSFGSPFFWLIIVATALGVIFSFTRARKFEGAGASKFGSLFLYILVASIGMHIDFGKVINEWESIKYILLIGVIWMTVHIVILLGVAKLIKAPFFFVAVGSQANIGGAASAPIVASAFSPALAPVGVLLAVLGYAIGTVGAIICMELMHIISF